MKTATVTVEGFTYELSPLPVFVGADLARRLAVIAGPLFEDSKGRAVGELASRAANAFRGEDIEAFGNAFASRCVVLSVGAREPLAPILDAHFSGRYIAFALWLKACLEFHFAPTFLDLLGRIGAQAAE